MITNIWILKFLEHKRGYGQRAVFLVDGPLFQTIECPKYEGHKRSGGRLGDPKIVIMGSRIGDILWTQDNDCLITQKMLELFNEQGFTGFEAAPVKNTVANNLDVDVKNHTLHELVVTGWAGDASTESGVHLLSYCPYCHLSTFSGVSDPTRLIDPAYWDGSDFFQVWPLPKFIFVTERVAEYLRKGQFKGFRLIPLKEFDSLGGTLGPGAPTRFKPHQRFKYSKNGEIENWKELLGSISWNNAIQNKDERSLFNKYVSLPKTTIDNPSLCNSSWPFYVPKDEKTD